jgi:hypothetical protein
LPDGKNTYYGLNILKIFNEEPYNKKRTIKWVENLNEGRLFGIKGIYYRLSALSLFDMKTEIPEEYASKLISKIAFNNLETAFLSTCILKMTGYNDLYDISDWILSFQKDDGGFGVNKSDIISTYYALESLNQIDSSLIKSKNRIINFTEQCKSNEGVFTFTPLNYPPYIETIYAGSKIHEIIGKKVKNSSKIIDFVLKLQNGNGGFRRSIYLGISELEYTYRAFKVLKILSYSFEE